jgi:hypothetical protein
MFSITAVERLIDADRETPGVQPLCSGDTDPVTELAWLSPAETFTEGNRPFHARSPVLFFPAISRALRSRPRFLSSAIATASSTVRVLCGTAECPPASCPQAPAKLKTIRLIQSKLFLFMLFIHKKYMTHKVIAIDRE